MRPIRLAPYRTLLLSTTVLLASASAMAQAPAPTPAPSPPAGPPPGPAASPGPASTPPPAAENLPPPAEPMPPPAAVPADPPAEEEETFPAAWFRIDSDLGGLQLWAGATHMLSDTVGIATDIYMSAFVGSSAALLGEFDIGPAFVAGPVTITPMLGLQADWSEHRVAALVPQLYVTGGPDPIYLELWLQNYAYTVFDKTGVTQAGGGNFIYGRFFIDYKFNKYFGVGPEVEFVLALNSKSKNAEGDSLTSLPIGLNVMLSSYGKSNNLFIFAGYETASTPNDKHLAGRLTFVHNF